MKSQKKLIMIFPLLRLLLLSLFIKTFVIETELKEDIYAEYCFRYSFCDLYLWNEYYCVGDVGPNLCSRNVTYATTTPLVTSMRMLSKPLYLLQRPLHAVANVINFSILFYVFYFAVSRYVVYRVLSHEYKI